MFGLGLALIVLRFFMFTPPVWAGHMANQERTVSKIDKKLANEIHDPFLVPHSGGRFTEPESL
jgi:hypothetical protein